ncbi:rhodanese-like domain-containing protein [Streptomyces sp. NPDC008121]|uniref:sulfurtransferase n=1 Tax=Streptomyces sp. NPDC008121 TaxID=3364809 RepID=UPI0036EC06B7
MNRDRLLVTTDRIDEHLSAGTAGDDLVLVEITDGGSQEGRIPGAVRLDWSGDLQDAVRRDVIGPEAFAALLGRHGISEDHTVVFYSGNNNWWAAAGYWQFRLYGHRELRLLDGGRARWEAVGGRLTHEAPERTPVTYPVPRPDESVRARREDLLDHIGRHRLLDVRSLEEYVGRSNTPPGVPEDVGVRCGHALSAEHIPWHSAVGPDGTFRSDEELERVYAGVGEEGTTVLYCRVGWRSAHSWFVLHELLGRRGVRNYDGAWREFGSLIGAPIVNGPLPWGPDGIPSLFAQRAPGRAPVTSEATSRA